ncbi:MAG TPA: NAD(P)H-hydrate dehydratase, partial [Candidatus Binataceae bacterium]
AILARWSAQAQAGVLVVAGKGNNGGDGFVSARKLHQSGIPVKAVLLARANDLGGDAARACSDFKAAAGKLIEAPAGLDASLPGGCGVIVDAIFGTGLNAEVRGLPRRAIELINNSSALVAAVDIPSGVNSDTGAVMGDAARAALTVTFGFAKYGHVSHPGTARCGDLKVVDIGFAPQAIKEISPRGRFVERADVGALLRLRIANSHKGMFGHPMVIAGSLGKSGASLLTSRAALRMGSGLVTAAIPDCVGSIVASGQAELMTEWLASRDGHLDADHACAALKSLIDGKDTLVVGPGLGLSDDTGRLVDWLIHQASEKGRPILLDADALNALASLGCETAHQARGPIVMTPHPGEMARLLRSETATVNADRISAARKLVEMTGACVLLKGDRSVIAAPGGELYVNSSGNPGMATPGMGDALSGMVGSLMGQHIAPLDALALGVFLHGFAADRVAARMGHIGYIAGDVIDELPAAMQALRS